MPRKNRLAIVAITASGAQLALRLWDAYPEASDLFLPERFIPPGGRGAKRLRKDLAAEAERLFKGYRAIAFVMAAGIVVRLIAPHIVDKREDPAVVVLDEKGEYVVSLLSGHIGGANGLACMLAALIGARPVITTASDIQGTLAVDTIAERLGCEVEDFVQAKKVTAAIVNGETISVYSCFDTDYLAEHLKTLPVNLLFYRTVEELLGAGPAPTIIISPFILPPEISALMGETVFLRPKALVVGMGCNRGTSAAELAGLYKRTLKAEGLSPLSVRNIATVEDKKDEAGLIEFAGKSGLKIKFITKKRLARADTPSGRSEAVHRNMGVYGVCEPAALVSAGVKTLLVKKRKSKNATIAVAEAPLL